MQSAKVVIDVPDSFTDGALASLRGRGGELATKVVAEASRMAADKRRPEAKVYEDDVVAAFDHYLSPPKRWQKALAWIGAVATVLAGVTGAIIGSVFGAEVLSASLPWVAVLSLVCLNALALVAFIAYKWA